MSNYRKFIVAAVTAVAMIPPAAFPQYAWAAPVIALCGAIVVRQTPNKGA